ncbi:hypothetical protein RHECNPAF_3500017 [Rhizobium etli CNPAF512]|nr:hypothetical protein RHECNPAF_3500017 [Rhizobium etli CNPAF512]
MMESKQFPCRPRNAAARRGDRRSVATPAVKNGICRSNGQVTTSLRRIEAFGKSFMHDLAAVHDIDVIGKLPAEVEILLDEQDRHAGGITQVTDRPADILDDRRLDALGRLVEYENPRPRHHGASDRQLLLLPAGKIAAPTREHRLQHREEAEDVIGDVAVAAAERCKAGFEIFFHRQQRKDFASLRHVADALLGPGKGRQAIQPCIVEGDGAGRQRMLAGHGAQKRTLADAVAPEHAGNLAHLRFDRDAAQRLRSAIMQICVFDCQHPFTHSPSVHQCAPQRLQGVLLFVCSFAAGRGHVLGNADQLLALLHVERL